MIVVLHQHSHHHHHGHSSKQHGPTVVGVPREVESVGSAVELNSNVMVKKHTNINVRAAFIHVIGDLFQSIGVVVAAYIIRFKVQCYNAFSYNLFGHMPFWTFSWYKNLTLFGWWSTTACKNLSTIQQCFIHQAMFVKFSVSYC